MTDDKFTDILAWVTFWTLVLGLVWLWMPGESKASEPLEDDAYICSHLSEYENGGSAAVRDYCKNLAKRGL